MCLPVMLWQYDCVYFIKYHCGHINVCRIMLRLTCSVYLIHAYVIYVLLIVIALNLAFILHFMITVHNVPNYELDQDKSLGHCVLYF